ncbi:hypothetical protein QYF36_012578 [Acer negundo]|nr:hypothetical protein QYF36_012578 [Acer negundo]
MYSHQDFHHACNHKKDGSNYWNRRVKHSREAYYPQNLTLSATAEKPKPKTHPQIAAQKLGLGFYNGKIRSQTAPQREEILSRFYSHCLSCCSSGAHDVVTKARFIQEQVCYC